jgi:hypothetical protein
MVRRTVRRTSGRGGLTALLAFVLCAGLPHAGWTQAGAPPEVVLLQGRQLVFGSLIPGVPERVSVFDAARRAELVIEGSGTVELMLLLPDGLAGEGGGSVPLRFGPGDAAVLAPGSAEAVAFDPHRSVRVLLDPRRGPTRILIGGTALASDAQIGGSYRATISVAVVNSGT